MLLRTLQPENPKQQSCLTENNWNLHRKYNATKKITPFSCDRWHELSIFAARQIFFVVF